MLAGQTLIVPGDAGERASYCQSFRVELDGSLTVLDGWHISDAGALVAAPPGEAEPPPSADAWAAGVAYVVDDAVIYNDITYVCLQPHTSIIGWEPPNVPALWAVV